MMTPPSERPISRNSEGSSSSEVAGVRLLTYSNHVPEAGSATLILVTLSFEARLAVAWALSYYPV